MELDKIKALLEKYFDGATSIAEENQLRTYFSSADVAPELEPYQILFGYFSQAKKERSPDKLVSLPKDRKNLTWLSIAASIVVLLGIGTFYLNQNNQPSKEDLGSFENPEIAFRETRKALSLLSGNVNKGVESVKYVKEYEIAKDKVFITN